MVVNQGKDKIRLLVLTIFCVIGISGYLLTLTPVPRIGSRRMDSEKETNMSTNNVAKPSASLVLDGSRLDGRVVLVEYSGGDQITVKEVVKDAAFFNGAASGDFIYRSRNNKWLLGNVRKPESIANIASVPEGVTYAALSPDRKMMLWCIEKGNNSSLVSFHLETGERHNLVSANGLIRAPSWSPKSNGVAYYRGRPDVLMTGGFTLELVTIAGSKNQTRQLASASHPTGITAERTQPPRWSPDGTRILFIGNYESNDLIKAYAYVVRTDGTGQKRVEGGVWSADGAQLLIVKRKQLPFGPLVLAIFNPSTGASSEINLPFDLPMSIGNGRWKPDAQMFAFITDENEVHLIDVSKQRKLKLLDFAQGANLIWLE